MRPGLSVGFCLVHLVGRTLRISHLERPFLSPKQSSASRPGPAATAAKQKQASESRF